MSFFLMYQSGPTPAIFWEGIPIPENKGLQNHLLRGKKFCAKNSKAPPLGKIGTQLSAEAVLITEIYDDILIQKPFQTHDLMVFVSKTICNWPFPRSNQFP